MPWYMWYWIAGLAVVVGRIAFVLTMTSWVRSRGVHVPDRDHGPVAWVFELTVGALIWPVYAVLAAVFWVRWFSVVRTAKRMARGAS